MSAKSKARCIGILTSGGDCPGLNAAIRAVAKAAINEYGMKVIGILDGFRGLVENRSIPLDDQAVSGIITRGGTILGTSRDKPHKMPMAGKILDMTEIAAENAKKLQLDCLVCLGGGGTQKNAWRLHKQCGLNVLTLPKTIDNDVVETDTTFGHDTGLAIATEAIDRLHTTATSHQRIIVCEVMGHKAGWLALSAGLAGGADVILIPELPYDLPAVAAYLRERQRTGKRFSIIAVAEGAQSTQEAEAAEKAEAQSKTKNHRQQKKHAKPKELGEVLAEDQTRERLPLAVRLVKGRVLAYHAVQEPMASRIARQLQELTGMEARVTTLGHVQRGGSPTAFDRLLCTLMGTKAAELMAGGIYNVMVAYKAERCVAVPLEKVAGRVKTVPLDHPMLTAAHLTGTCLGQYTE